jgi:hypothetical protein
MADEVQETTTVMPVKEHRNNKLLLPVIVAVLILVGAGAYFWRDQQARTQQKKLQAEIATLQSQINGQTPATAVTQQTATAQVPSQEMIDNIKAVFASGNSAALEGYMASTVRVIYAASEGLGNRTPAEATGDVTDFMTKATDPWNFDLPAATLNDWASGDYKEYFPSNAVVGKSDDLAISFTFNSAGKISGVFMTNTTSVL